MTLSPEDIKADLEASRILEDLADQLFYIESHAIEGYKLIRASNHLLERSRWGNLG